MGVVLMDTDDDTTQESEDDDSADKQFSLNQ